MSREMKNFADYFMQGLQLGGKWANDWEARQIAKQRNILTEARNKAQDARENRKLDLYGHGVMASAELARARAQAALRPKGGGGGAGVVGSADADALRKEASDRGIITAPAAPAAAPQQNFYGGSDGGSDAPVPEPPAGAPVIESDSRGGMVGSKRYASGGIVEGMSLEEADKYRDAGSGKPKSKANPLGGALSSALSKDYKTTRDEAGAVRPMGPSGSGTGGSYTTADVPTLTAGAGWYAEGGMVRYGEGKDLTQAYDPEAMAIETRRYAPPPSPPPQYQSQDTGSANAATGNTSGTVGGSTAAGGGGSEAAVGGSGGVGGSASSDAGAGGSAAAGTGGADGGTYRRGGGVRRFQSGGRVMREPTAIDTGTTGPMSGYGYRAAPPANARRR